MPTFGTSIKSFHPFPHFSYIIPRARRGGWEAGFTLRDGDSELRGYRSLRYKVILFPIRDSGMTPVIFQDLANCEKYLLSKAGLVGNFPLCSYSILIVAFETSYYSYLFTCVNLHIGITKI